jgi:predicted amidohydrolase
MKHAIIAIAFVWWILAGICGAADSPATILCGHVKFSGTRYPPPALANRLRAATSNILETATTLVQAYPALDLITTPEYSLYYSESLANYSISVTLTNTGQNYELVLGQSHSELLRAITNIQAFADRHDVYFLLGTVPELIRPASAKYPHLPARILSNTMLIIDPNGRIVDIDRKTSGSDWVQPDQTVGSAGGDEALLIMNSTTRVRTLPTRDYHALRYLPVICAERRYGPMLQVVSNACADMLVELAWEGDMNLEELARNYYAHPGDTNYWQENFFNSTWRQPHTVT